MAMQIGELSRRTGIAPPTIRYYEEVGLLKRPARASSGYRAYSSKTVDELLFIKKAQQLGFSLDEITEILQLSRSGRKPCDRVLALSHKHLDAVDQRIRDLQRFRSYLAGELEKWDRQGTAVRCDGLCQFISDAEPAPEAPRATSRLAARAPGLRPPSSSAPE